MDQFFYVRQTIMSHIRTIWFLQCAPKDHSVVIDLTFTEFIFVEIIRQMAQLYFSYLDIN